MKSINTRTGSLAQQTVKLLKPFELEIIGISKSGHHKDGFDNIYTRRFRITFK